MTKLCNKRVLSTGEPCTCEYVTLLQSFHRGTLSIHWYMVFQSQNSLILNFLVEICDKTRRGHTVLARFKILYAQNFQMVKVRR